VEHAAGAFPRTDLGLELRPAKLLTTAKVGAAFPGNDWIAFPGGDGYLKNLGRPSQRLLSALALLRQQHLHAVATHLNAIDKGNVTWYLDGGFKCPQN
jgi:hypothetical protein